MQAVIKCDGYGFVTNWAPEAEEILGYSSSETIGWAVGIFLQSIEKGFTELDWDVVIEKAEDGEVVVLSTTNLRSDLKACSNTLTIVQSEEGIITVTMVRDEDSDMIKEYNALVEMEEGKALAVTTADGMVLGVNGKFAMFAKTNRMNLLNRQIARIDNAMYYDLSDFDVLEGLLVAFDYTPSTKKDEIPRCGMRR